ncbi:MAG: UDP-2,3-diacylglucosamine diphosphatase [Legionellales bacterium RIFCSPHIGHO2_12_FULL_35_11]|nr:MAG: UDP-2,3-diacylglucosamine diphosphatase [Legionellales bacterium RIFCSPHIGHO2_12_FULL_35_11]
MSEAMFISDLHLHPEHPKLTNKFFAFLNWSVSKTKSLYILGDFFHVWPGDDAIDSWSEKIANEIAALANHGIKVYFLAGNRDFLIGQKFISKARMTELVESSVIKLGNDKVILVHGDRYCVRDRSHQILRRFTRNRLFKLIFLRTPYKFRSKVVNSVRRYSQNNRSKPVADMITVPTEIVKHLSRNQVDIVVHGHTHTPGLVKHNDKKGNFYQYVLSDWEEKPLIMCYNNTGKFYYVRFEDYV